MNKIAYNWNNNNLIDKLHVLNFLGLEMVVVRLCYFSAPVANAVLEPYKNPCVPSPCGPNAFCQEIRNMPSCTCMSNYIGSPPNCKPECTINAECPTSEACIQQKCRDPCQGSCGIGALCTVSRHMPICTCPDGYTGDAFTVCSPKPPGTYYEFC